MTENSEVRVDGLQIPQILVAMIHEGRWVVPDDPRLLTSVFGEDPQQPTFYQLNGIERENRAWHSEMDPETREWYVGLKSVGKPPGDIDPVRSLLIGDLGPDQPFALDYRTSATAPSVIYLTSRNGWVEIAPNIEVLLQLLKIG